MAKYFYEGFRSEIPAGTSKVQELRELLVDYPDMSKLSDSYLDGVISVPNRAFDYTVQKMINCMNWRRDMEVNSLTPEDCQEVLACGSLYWYGYSKSNRPILWVRPSKKDWRNLNIEEEVKMHVLMIEAGIKLMPKSIDTFMVIADSSHLRFHHMNIPFMRSLGQILTVGYPDRLERLCAGPVNFLVRSLYTIMKAFIPNRIFGKIILMSEFEELQEFVDEEDLPDFLGGPANHELELYEDGNFSWEKMILNQEQKLKDLENRLSQYT